MFKRSLDGVQLYVLTVQSKKYLLAPCFRLNVKSPASSAKTNLVVMAKTSQISKFREAARQPRMRRVRAATRGRAKAVAKAPRAPDLDGFMALGMPLWRALELRNAVRFSTPEDGQSLSSSDLSAQVDMRRTRLH